MTVGKYSYTLLVSDAKQYADYKQRREDKVLEVILQRVQPGSSVWDIGANVGLYSVVFAVATGPAGSVVAFEPVGVNLDRLRANVALNKLDNVRACRVALGIERAEMQLRLGTDAFPTNSRLVAAEADAGPACESVQVIPGDVFLEQEKLAVPDLIKIDVEGAEYDVLLGLRETLSRPECRSVLCEVHASVLDAAGKADVPQKIVAYLKERGFDEVRWLDFSHVVAYRH